MDIQKLVDTMSEEDRRLRSSYHVTLGELIDDLRQADSDMVVYIDDSKFSPGKEMSYRGYYSDLAFDASSTAKRVSELLDQTERALDSTYTGYKGGEYVMGQDTPLWISGYGRASGNAVVSIQADGDHVSLITKVIE